MKIQEIISESYVEEAGISTGIGIGRKLFGKSVSFISNIIRNSSSKKQVIEALTAIADNTGKIDINNPAAQAAISKFGPGIISKAEKLAKEIKYKNDLALIRGKISTVSGVAKQVGSSIGNILKISGKVLVAMGFYDTAHTYLTNMAEAVAQVESGSMTPAQFSKYRLEQTTKLVKDLAFQLGAVFAVNKASKIAGWVGSKAEQILTFGGLYKLPGVAAISKLKSASTVAAQIYFVNKISSPEGTEAMAKVILEPMLSAVYALTDAASAIPGVDYIKQQVEDAKKLVNAIAGQSISSTTGTTAPTEPSTTSPSTVAPAEPTKQTKFVSSTTPMTQDDWASLIKSVKADQSNGK